jgi:hypothetical protein
LYAAAVKARERKEAEHWYEEVLSEIQKQQDVKNHEKQISKLEKRNQVCQKSKNKNKTNSHLHDCEPRLRLEQSDESKKNVVLGVSNSAPVLFNGPSLAETRYCQKGLNPIDASDKKHPLRKCSTIESMATLNYSVLSMSDEGLENDVNSRTHSPLPRLIAKKQ